MTFSLIASVVLGLAAAQTSAPATPPQVEPAPVVQPAAQPSETISTTDADDKVICRKVRSVGSNMVTRDCRTAAQRRKEAEQARDAMRNSGRSINNLDTGAQ
jgi:hypothetical protein